MEKVKRYRQFPIFRYPERTWMDKEVEKAPLKSNTVFYGIW